jgi:glycerophosphoryl diester phosphodiesterase
LEKRLELPPLIGHRGAAAVAPENTIAGLKRAVDAGLTWVEIDTRLSDDDVPMVIHDATLERTTNGKGFVGDLSVVQLGALDAGSWFNLQFFGEPVPTLEHYLRQARDLGIGVNVELKPERHRDGRLAGEVLDVIDSVYHTPPPILISSFSAKALLTCRNIAPDLARGWLVEQLPEGWRTTLDDLAVSSLHINHENLSAPILMQLIRYGTPLVCYTVNNRARAEKLLRAGVVSIITDHPDLLDEPAD